MTNLEIKREALAILLTLDNVDENTKNVATTYVNNNINEDDGIMWRIYSQHKSFAKHLENIYNSNIENPTIKESLIDEYNAISDLLHCIQMDANKDAEGYVKYDIDADALFVYTLAEAKKWLTSSKMLKDFENNGYKVSISMTGVYLVHGHRFKTLKEAHEAFFK